MTGMPSGKRKTHRGRRGRGFGAKPSSGVSDGEVKTHLANAHAAPSHADAKKHLFKALSSMKKCAPAMESSDIAR